jgi:MFS family permease
MILSLQHKRELARMDRVLSGDPVLGRLADLFVEPAQTAARSRSRLSRGVPGRRVRVGVRAVGFLLAAIVAMMTAVAGGVVVGALGVMALAAAAAIGLVGVASVLAVREMVREMRRRRAGGEHEQGVSQ